MMYITKNCVVSIRYVMKNSKKAVQPVAYENRDKAKGKKISEEVEFSAVNYIGMIPILIGAVKEQRAIITSRKNRIDDLEKRLKAIEKKLL